MYIERWLTAPFEPAQDTRLPRDPQGGADSPILMNLFMRYVVDVWMQRHFPQYPFARYADDAVVHSRSREQAQEVMHAIASRLAECGLTTHPEKSKIVYCKDRSRPQTYPNVTFTFSGLSVSSAKGHDQVRAGLYQLSARGQSCCLETDATDGAGVAAASPNVQATGRTRRAMSSHDTWLVELLRRLLSDIHAWALSVSRPEACALGSAQVQNSAVVNVTVKRVAQLAGVTTATDLVNDLSALGNRNLRSDGRPAVSRQDRTRVRAAEKPRKWRRKRAIGHRRQY